MPPPKPRGHGPASVCRHWVARRPCQYSPCAFQHSYGNLTRADIDMLERKYARRSASPRPSLKRRRLSVEHDDRPVRNPDELPWSATYGRTCQSWVKSQGRACTNEESSGYCKYKHDLTQVTPKERERLLAEWARARMPLRAPSGAPTGPRPRYAGSLDEPSPYKRLCRVDTTDVLKLGLEDVLADAEPGNVVLASLPTHGSLDEVLDAVYRHNVLARAFAAIAKNMAASVNPRYSSPERTSARRHSTVDALPYIRSTHELASTPSPSKHARTASTSSVRGSKASNEVKPIVFELSDAKPSSAALASAIAQSDGRAHSEASAPRLLDRIGSSVPSRGRRASEPPEAMSRDQLFAPLMTAIRSANSFRGGPPLKSQVGGLLRRETAIALGFPNQGALMNAAQAAGLVELGRTPGLQGADTIRII